MSEQVKSFDGEFKTLREMGTETFVLRGSTIIVEILEQEEVKTAGGIIVVTDSKQRHGGIDQHRLQAAKVLMTGPGYWNEPEVGGGGYYEPLEVQPGAIVILPQFAAQYISVFPGIQRPTQNKLALIKMDSVQAYYPSEEAYNKAKAALG